MNELQLVGYTADLQHLVLSDAAGASRFRVPVDDDLLATVEEVVGLTRPEFSFLQPAPAPTPPPVVAPEPSAPPEPAGPAPGEGALAASAVLVQRATSASEAEVAEQQRGSRLSPREIQALLRAGKTPAAVAKLAGTDEALIRRWLPPIEAERDQVLQGVWRQRVSKARLGASRDPLGDAVRRNLVAKNVHPDDEDVRWTAARRDGDDVWSVELRYRSRNRSHRALWRYDPETRVLEARNDLATEIAWTRPRPGAAEADAGSGTAAGTPADLEGVTAAEETSEDGQAERSTSGATPARRTGKTAGKKSAVTASARKSATTRSAKKAAGTKSAAKKATKKGAASRSAATGSAATGSAAKGSAAKKAAAKPTAKRVVAKKLAVKKATPAKQTVPTGKSTAKKAAPAKKALIRRPRPPGTSGSAPAPPADGGS